MTPQPTSRSGWQRGLLLFFGILSAGVALPLVASANEFKARIVGHEALRLSAYASAGQEGRHAFTVREFDPLVNPRFNVMSPDPDKDLTLAIYGAGDKTSWGYGPVVRIAGARANPATLVVMPGVPVTIRNDDPFTHHLVSSDGTVNRDLKPGESHKYEPKAKGAPVVFTDTLTPSVKAWIVVDDGVIANRAPGHDGAVKLDLTASSELVVKTYFEGQVKATTPVKVPATGSVELKEPIAVGPVPAASVAPSASTSK